MKLEEEGHIPGPCIDANKAEAPEEGFYPYFADGPRYRNEYMDARQLPSMLLELHAITLCNQSLLGVYAFFADLMRAMRDHSEMLLASVDSFMAGQPDTTVLEIAETDPIPAVPLRGTKYNQKKFEVSGKTTFVWADEPVSIDVPMSSTTHRAVVVDRPRAYWVPAGSVRIPTDQPLRTMAVLLLEPAGIDSISMGIFQRDFDWIRIQRGLYNGAKC